MPPTALFRDLPRKKFPVHLEFISMATGQTVWDTTITETGGAVQIPPLADEHGPVRSRVTFGDGEVQESEPPEPPSNA